MQWWWNKCNARNQHTCIASDLRTYRRAPLSYYSFRNLLINHKYPQCAYTETLTVQTFGTFNNKHKKTLYIYMILYNVSWLMRMTMKSQNFEIKFIITFIKKWGVLIPNNKITCSKLHFTCEDIRIMTKRIALNQYLPVVQQVQDIHLPSDT